ncbi:Rho GTPase activation protein [Schizophyllum amplum]|uniref:Rho GTPase activation protein n=1 Tax=Schizophyllum amplum TaxID=97359 RepID=A0A550CHZ7_9AGAR|nr:Rho GTPase activation protein [Auriculariopsis ampla]
MVSEPDTAPTKASLKAWWTHFTSAQKMKRDAELRAQDEHPVFGKPLRESLRYASVQISTANANGDLYVWGSIPVVVAKCGLYLKENATEVPGTFRVNGSNKRMRELQQAFELPPRYGKDLDWKQETYTTHDVASVFRRYLTQMPEPVIPYDLYHEFRDSLSRQPNTHDQVVANYKRLLRSMPPHNQYLLLYVLDLLSVFARKADKNLMTAENLAVIFRPGIISHPSHELSPNEHRLSQKVLEFLIAHQELFIFDIPPPPGTPGSPIDEDFLAVPSSDDEQSQIGGGWRLVGRNRSQRVARRKTIDRTDHPPKSASPSLDPVLESGGPEEGAQVKRRRTLPSVRSPSLRASASGSITSARDNSLRREGSQKREREVDSGTQSDREERRVLRKQRRPSTSNLRS